MKIPIQEIYSVTSGFYAGYYNGAGVELSPSKEQIAIYGPTVVAVFGNLILKKILKESIRSAIKISSNGLKDGNLNIFVKGKGNRKLSELSKSEKEELIPRIEENTRNLEKKLENLRYINPTIRAGTSAAIFTGIGYAGGYTLAKLLS